MNHIQDHLAISRLGQFEQSTFLLWSSGIFYFGSFDFSNIKNKFTSQGVTVGVDYRIETNTSPGLALGYGTDTSKIDEFGTHTKSQQITGSFYGTYQPSKEWSFIALAGYGATGFENSRGSSRANEIQFGKRSGNIAFGSLTPESVTPHIA